MSIKLMVEIREHSPAQNGERLVLLALADYANDEAKAWPSIPSLAKWANLSERSVQNALRGLEARGEITTEIAAGPHGCNLFYITPGGTQDASDEFPLPAPPAKSARKRKQKAAAAEEETAEEESPADIVESEQCGTEQGGADIAPVQIVHPADIAPVGDEHDNHGGADIAPGGCRFRREGVQILHPIPYKSPIYPPAAAAETLLPELQPQMVDHAAAAAVDSKVEIPDTSPGTKGATVPLLDRSESQIASLAKNQPGELIRHFRAEHPDYRDRIDIKHKKAHTSPNVLVARCIVEDWLPELREERDRKQRDGTTSAVPSAPTRDARVKAALEAAQRRFESEQRESQARFEAGKAASDNAGGDVTEQEKAKILGFTGSFGTVN